MTEYVVRAEAVFYGVIIEADSPEEAKDEMETLLTDYGFGDLDADGVDVEVSRVSEYSREEFE